MHASHSTIPFGRRIATELAILGAITTSFPLLAATFEYTPIVIQTSETAVSGLVDAYNQPNNSSAFYESAFEYGAQATLQPGSPSVLRNVTLPYYSSYGLTGGLTFRVYANDGAMVGTSPSPGTLLSEVFTDVKGGGLTTLSVGYAFNAANTLPPTVTVTLTFKGLGGDNTAGWYLSTADNLAGLHPEFLWVRDSENNWARKSFTVVPEPSVANLVAIGGVALGLLQGVRIVRQRR